MTSFYKDKLAKNSVIQDTFLILIKFVYLVMWKIVKFVNPMELYVQNVKLIWFFKIIFVNKNVIWDSSLIKIRYANYVKIKSAIDVKLFKNV